MLADTFLLICPKQQKRSNWFFFPPELGFFQRSQNLSAGGDPWVSPSCSSPAASLRGRALRWCPHGWDVPRAALGPHGSACPLCFDCTGRSGSAAVPSDARASRPSVLLVGISGRLYQAVRSGKHFLSSVPTGHCSVWLPSSLTCPAMFLLRSVNAQKLACCHPAQRSGTQDDGATHRGTRHAPVPTRAHAGQRAPGWCRRRAHTSRALPCGMPCLHRSVRSRWTATSRGRLVPMPGTTPKALPVSVRGARHPESQRPSCLGEAAITVAHRSHGSQCAFTLCPTGL